MSIRQFIELLDELIAVDTDDFLVKGTKVEKNKIIVELRSGTKFILTVEKE